MTDVVNMNCLGQLAISLDFCEFFTKVLVLGTMDFCAVF